MIKGIGVDIVENARVAKLYEKYQGRFVEKILTEREREIYRQKKNKALYLASRWAAKEAVSKALGTGLKCGIKNIEIVSGENGQPQVNLYKKALKEFEKNGCKKIEISISHERQFSVAFVVTL